jgi:hypothetical protein
VDSGKVGRFVLIRVMTEMLEGFLEIDLNFLEGLNCSLPLLMLTKSRLASSVSHSLRRMGRTQLYSLGCCHDIAGATRCVDVMPTLSGHRMAGNGWVCNLE